MTSSGTTRTCGCPRRAREVGAKTHDKIVERGRRARIRKYDKEAEDELPDAGRERL